MEPLRFRLIFVMQRRRLALIFGNDDYGGTNQLSTCVKDANDMTTVLTKQGWFFYCKLSAKQHI